MEDGYGGPFEESFKGYGPWYWAYLGICCGSCQLSMPSPVLVVRCVKGDGQRHLELLLSTPLLRRGLLYLEVQSSYNQAITVGANNLEALSVELARSYLGYTFSYGLVITSRGLQVL